MSKKKWLLAIIVCVALGYLVVSKINPTAGWTVDKIVGGAVGNAKKGVESTVIWQQYDVWFGVAFGAVVTGLLVYKGRNIYDNVRGIARYRATDAAKTVTLQKEPSEPEQSYQPQPKVVAQEEPQQEQTA